jgi:hypothetical protein
MKAAKAKTPTMYVVDLPYAYYQIQALDNVVIFAAPIAKWMVNKPLDQVKSWVHSKGGNIFPYSLRGDFNNE